MRLGIGLATIGVVVALTWLAISLSTDDQIPSILLNTAAELFGIVATVLIIDNLLDMRRRDDDRRRIAREVVHELDHAIWVWQGGRRSFNPKELLWLCARIQPTDPVPPYLQNLFIRLGSRSANTVRLRGELVREKCGFSAALEKLSELEGIRDDGTVMVPATIQAIVQPAALALLGFLKEDTVVPSQDDFCQRDPTEERQYTRHFGKETN